MSNKLTEMNRMKADLSDRGIKVEPSTSYDDLVSLHRKHCGGRVSTSGGGGRIDFSRDRTDYSGDRKPGHPPYGGSS